MSGKIKETFKLSRKNPSKIMGIIGAAIVIAIGVYCSFALSSCDSSTQVSTDTSDLTSLITDSLNSLSETDSDSVSTSDSSSDTASSDTSSSDSSGNSVSSENDSSSETASSSSQITVHICGAVNNPGVYELNSGNRIINGIEAAGGFTSDADEDFLNLAETLCDGDRIYVPTVTEVQEGYTISSNNVETNNSDSGLVNINTAGVGELSSLPGIGETKAQSIVDYRNANGNFTSVDQIKQVNGIKEGVYEQIADKITI